jgi:hypothetical protein
MKTPVGIAFEPPGVKVTVTKNKKMVYGHKLYDSKLI